MVEEAPTYDVAYWLDGDDRIVSVSGGWDRFADENGGAAAAEQNVLGRPLLDFVRGDTTRMYMAVLLQTARMLGGPLVRPYRCDSPDTRRYMEMRMTREPSGLLRVEHHLVRTQGMARRVAFVEGQSARERCSMCNRVQVGGVWAEPDTTPLEPEVTVAYAMCDVCSATA